MSYNEYDAFLQSKKILSIPTGIEVPKSDINTKLFDFQKDIVHWALRRGRAAIFADCGLGKTPMQLEWAHLVPGNVLILAPLAVSQQTIREGEKFGIEVSYARKQADVNGKVTITNYEMLDHFDAAHFNGVVLDESSILKSFMGKIKRQIIDKFKDTQYKLACTATPAPNDYLELGNHADFLNVMPSNEMISRFFINNTMQAGDYRLKEHAREHFWEWVASWAVCIAKPSDIGYEDNGFILPALHYHDIKVNAEYDMSNSDSLFPMPIQSATELYKINRQTLDARCAKVKDLVENSKEPWIIWCHTNDESAKLKAMLSDCVEVKGSDSIDEKEARIKAFSLGQKRVIVTKPSITGFGINWQHCSNVIFVSLDYSYESVYQAVRRSYRFGQNKEVHVYLISSDLDRNVVHTLQGKEKSHKKMQDEMVLAMRNFEIAQLKGNLKLTEDSPMIKHEGANFTAINADCIEAIKQIPDNSVDFSVYSPPFSGIYIYSDSLRDMGNTKNDDEFFEHYKFLIKEKLRITRPGRLTAVHCKNLVKYMGRDGQSGLKDFRGEIIRAHAELGWQYHSEVVIWKDPVTEMQRTKAHGLLHKQVCKDSSYSRMGVPDYLLMFRKWDGNPEEFRPISHEGGFTYYVGNDDPIDAENARYYSIQVWQRYASPVWFDINQMNVLSYKDGRDDKDEKHICPLQLDVIRRALHLWTNPGDTVFSPFMGIGSEGYCALEMGRKFIGVELKESYFNQAVKNISEARNKAATPTLFDTLVDQK